MRQFVGERFHIIGASPRVNVLAHLRLFLNVDLRVARDACREVGRQGDGFVECVGVQRLSVSQSGGHGLDAGASYVVEGVLFGERPARGLRVGAQCQ